MSLDAEMPLERRVRRPWDEDFPDGCREMLVDEEEKEPVGEDSGRPFLRGGSRKHQWAAENSSLVVYMLVTGC